ncbi:MAG: BrnT family toxin [Alphaproteobacteria bacterium]|nr:BrnT family toxin [Alphaproteobacteria bacterium]MDE2164546.1 BrnT family toxin [Alphaproteobacteria bacterium]MDE2265841.1 BrnT family toxin [Alphaproteobacteria bacterium]
MEFAGFDWDDGNRAKCEKHGVSIATIESLFRRGLIVLPDDSHSLRERRFRAVGRSTDDRAVFVVFTLRERLGKKLIRPISARYMHRKEAEHYAKTYET